MDSDGDSPTVSAAGVAELETSALSGSSLADPDVLYHPNPFYRMLRRADPVRYDQKLGLYLVARHEDLCTVLADWETYSLELGYNRQWGQGHLEELKAILARDGGGFIPDFIMSDPPRHGRMRRLLERAFTPRRLKLLEPSVCAFVADQVERFAEVGAADGIADFALPMSINFMLQQLQLTDVDPHRVERWAHAYVAQFSGLQSHAEMRANAALICELQHYIMGAVRERQACPGEDMISDLLRPGADDAAPLTFEEVTALARALLIGGHDTISTALANVLFLAATQSDIAARLYGALEDDLALARFVEECLRLEPPVRGLSRVTTRDAELGGVQIPAGAQLLLLFASGNDDERVFAEPRRFDADRENLGRHLSFGGGIHRCVGQPLARMQVKTAAREIARRLDDIRLAVPVAQIRYRPTIATLSIENLPLTFRRRARDVDGP
jgi:cytochrome P450